MFLRIVKHHARCSCGYTLIETVLALVVLCSIVVPLLNIFYRGGVVADARKELTGIWLVEREAAIVRAFPGQALPVKRQTVKSDEWTIRTEVSESLPKRYRITSEIGGNIRAEACFYGRTGDERK